MIQWSVVGVIVLIALVLAAVKIARLGHKAKKGEVCGCCSHASDCKAKDLKVTAAKERESGCRCHDGQSARN